MTINKGSVSLKIGPAHKGLRSYDLHQFGKLAAAGFFRAENLDAEIAAILAKHHAA
jgi:hypothetical protein